MYASAFVLGFHGCDESVGEQVLAGREPLAPSSNDYDWLGLQQTEELADFHRGLAMIHRLATRVTSARHGAELTLDFTY